MSKTTQDESTSSANSGEFVTKFGLSKVVGWVRANISTLSAVVSVLCTAFVIAVSAGSTSHAIETLNDELKEDRITLMRHAEDIAMSKTHIANMATIVDSLVSIAKAQGAMESQIESLTRDVSRLVDERFSRP